MSGADNAAALRLVVGLGNPGAEYEQTRHNAGFWFCEQLAQHYRVQFTAEKRFHALLANVPAAGLAILLPQTFMNRSGQAVGAYLRFFRIPPQQMLVVHDELDILPGQLRLKFGGGLGGHNGLKDIAAHCATQDFWRLRIGIGHPGDRNRVVDYVLKSPGSGEHAVIEEALQRAHHAWPLIAKAQWNAAATQINARDKSATTKD